MTREAMGWILAAAIVVAASFEALLWLANRPPSSGYGAFAIERRGCDKAFHDLMTSSDPAVVNRAGWTLDLMNCGFSRRFVAWERQNPR